MDIELKKELNETWTANYDAGVGSYGRYIQKIFANRMTDRSRLSLTGNLNDDDARSNNKSFGVDFHMNNGKTRKENRRFEMGGHIGFHDSRSHSQTWRNAENYTGTTNASQFSNSNNYSKNKSSGLGGNLRMEWHPDTMTTVTANTNLSFNKSHSFSRSRSARFNNDPYTITNDEDPLDNVFDKDFSAEYMPELFKATINRNSNSSKSQGNSYSFGLNGNLTAKAETSALILQYQAATDKTNLSALPTYIITNVRQTNATLSKTSTPPRLLIIGVTANASAIANLL